MSIETALYNVLHDRAALAALVDVRIYPMFLPQQPTFPAVAYRRTGTQPVMLLSTDTNILEARFEVAAFSKTYDQCINVANEVRQALQRFQGTKSGVEVMDVVLDNIDDNFEPDFEIYESTIDVTISYRT